MLIPCQTMQNCNNLSTQNADNSISWVAVAPEWQLLPVWFCVDKMVYIHKISRVSGLSIDRKRQQSSIHWVAHHHHFPDPVLRCQATHSDRSRARFSSWSAGSLWSSSVLPNYYVSYHVDAWYALKLVTSVCNCVMNILKQALWHWRRSCCVTVGQFDSKDVTLASHMKRL